MSFTSLLRSLDPQSRPTGIPCVLFLLPFVPAEMHLLGINDDNKINEDEVGADMALAAQTFAKPATVADYYKAMQGQSLPSVKIVRRPTKTQADGSMARAASTSDQSKGDKRPFMRKWQCAQIVDGKPCHTSNFYYVSMDKKSQIQI